MDSIKKFMPWLFGMACIMPGALIGCLGAILFVTLMFSVSILGKDLEEDSSINSVATTCGETVKTLVEGYDMMPTTGKLGVEQHLSLSSGETATEHYQKSATPSYARNGMAGGYGGLNSGPPSVVNERWASNTQWYWWLLPGCHANPCLDKKCQEARRLTPHARIVLTNKKTGRSVVTSAEESGPACWVTQQDGRNWGATGEVAHLIGSNGTEITAAFAKDQKTPLGPCNN